MNNNNQLINNDQALRLFFNDEVYLVEDYSTNNVNVPLSNEESAPSIVTPKTEAAQKPKKHFNFDYLGKNEKKVLLLVDDANNKVSNEEGTEFLRKILKAINFKTPDFALVNIANYKGAKYTDLKAFFDFRILISFGMSYEDLGLPTSTPHVISTHENTKIIVSSHLNDLINDIPNKKILWKNFQQLFQ